MPPRTRRSANGTQNVGGLAKGQSTLSFSGRVTKGVPHHTKKAVIDSPVVAKVDVKNDTSGKEERKEVRTKPDEEIPLKEEDSFVEEPEPTVVVEKSESELKAEKITAAKLNKYWKDIEKQRKAPRVHQSGLDTYEKILRYFDVSSQYGPCIGVTRLKRWQRAERLGLNPPIEVLAVLVKEAQAGEKGFQIAQMDQILGSTAIGSKQTGHGDEE